MSWLGSGFSQIRGQISDFTKEVLTETTEEIDDPATQLHLSRRRISELETWVSSQQAENKRLQHENAELVDKLESAELQISAVSKEYRAIVDTKETELKQLREQHQDRSLDLSPDIYSSSHSAAILPHSSSAPALCELFAEPGDEDFDDVIACQREINQLRSEVQRLNAEVRHWKKCNETTERSINSETKDSTSQLRNRIQELTEQVRDEVDQHQRELAALQDVHAQKIATLQSQHRAQINAVHDQSETVSSSSGDLKQLQDKCRHLEDVRHKLTFDLEQTHAADREKARQMTALQQQRDSLQRERDKVIREKAELQEKQDDLLAEHQQLVDERHQLKIKVREFSEQIKRLRDEGPPESPTGFAASTPIPTGKRRLPKTPSPGSSPPPSPRALNLRNDELSQQVETLQQQLQVLETSIGDFDVVKSDWEMEKEALEQVLLKLREEVREKEALLKGGVKDDDLWEKLEVMEAEKAALEEERDQLRKCVDEETVSTEPDVAAVQRELEQTRADLAQVKEACSALEAGVGSVQSEKDELQQRLSKAEVELEEREEELLNLSAEAAYVEEFRIQLEDKMAEISALKAEKGESEVKTLKEQLREASEEKSALEQSLIELDEQNQAAMEQIIQSRNTLTKSNSELKERILVVEGEVEKARQEREAMREKYEKAALTLNDLHMEREELKKKAEELGRLLEVARGDVKDIKRHRDRLESRCEELEKHVQEMGQETEDGDQLREMQQKYERAEEERKTFEQVAQRLKASLQEAEEEIIRTQEEMTKRRSDEVEALIQKNAKEVEEAEQRVTEAAEKSQRLEACVEEMRKGRDLDGSTSEAEELMRSHQESMIASLEAQLAKTQEEAGKKERELNEIIDRQKEKLMQEMHRDDEDGREQELEQLKEDLARKDLEFRECSRKCDEYCAILQENSEALAEAERSSERLMEVEGELKEMSRQLGRAKKLLPQERLDLLEGENDIPDEKQNGSDVILNGDATEMHEIEKLRFSMNKKDELVSELNNKNASLTHLLEEKSAGNHGNQVLLEVHRLENESRSLRMEKEQMMSILNEKTRECSSLKSEVRRLMNVVSQEKQAITKLQQDNQELRTPKEAPNQDMSKEAIKRLSQIIKDKDLEIESLGQKNQTLLQVLSSQQSSEADGAQVVNLMQERDNLQSQVRAFQADREQIITALNAKHQESLAYHNEIQRLNAALHERSELHEKVDREYQALAKSFQDKQQALMKSQNELINYKQRFTDLERKHAATEPDKEEVEVEEEEVVKEEVQWEASTEELQALRSIIKSQEESAVEKDRVLSQREASLRQKEQLIHEQEATLCEKDRSYSDLTLQLHQCREVVAGREAELSALKKQHEHLVFQLQGLKSDAEDVSQERDRLQERSNHLQQELTAHKDAHNHLTITLHDKEFEAQALREKTATLTAMLQRRGEQDDSENTEAQQRLMQEREAAQQRAQGLQQEKDQVMLALQQQQMDAQELRQEMQRMHSREAKLANECERLRGHLLQIEEGYTAEALQAEHREKELRNKLAAAQEQLLSSSSAVKASNMETNKHMEAMQQQLHVLATQRDQACMQLATAQETAKQYAASLSNLQNVLEQFQMEKEQQQASEVERYQRELQSERREAQKLREELATAEAELEETTDALEAAHRLSEQLDRKEELIIALREEVQLREAELKKTEEEVTRLTSSTEAKVDKMIIKSLLFGYFHTPQNKRGEVLLLIGRVLGFSPAEMQQLEPDTGQKRWFGGIFRQASPTPPSTPKKTAADKTFAQMFVNFLEKESTPQMPGPRLPAERMVREELERHQHSSTPSTPVSSKFNPFAAPMHATLPLQVPPPGGMTLDPARSAAPNNSQLLSNPLTSGTVPIFAAPSESSSGRSTPASSSAILRDVLQQ